MVLRQLMKKTTLYIVIGLVFASLIGLAYVQVRWLKDGLQLASQKFDERVFEALESFYDNNEAFIESNFNQPIEDPDALRYDLENRLKYEFDHSLILTDFELAVVDLNKNVIFGDPNGDIISNQCKYPLGCNYAMGLNFPEKQKILYGEMGKTMLPSIFSILLLAGAFIYIFWLFKRQKKLSEIKNDFINNMTHEFKTPLASISLSNHVLQNDQTAKNDRKSYYQVIDLETKRLQSHIDKILQIAQLDSGNFTLESKEIDLNEIVESVVVSFNPLIQQDRLDIALDLAEEAVIAGDEEHLGNVLYNLLDNAIKYTKGKPQIAISTESSNGHVVLTVADNGIGMNKNVQRHVFEKFYRGSSGNIHNVKGFGLGLNYVKNIIEAHRGLISLKSAPNKGTSFSIQLPAL